MTPPPFTPPSMRLMIDGRFDGACSADGACDRANRHQNLPSISCLLNTNGSFTKMLETLSGTPLGVQVVLTGWHILSVRDRLFYQQFGITDKLAWRRQVLLFPNQQAINDRAAAWVAADSWFFLSSLKGDGARLRHLRATPIGYVLFKKPQTRTVWRQIVPSMPNMQCARNSQNGARQTLYDWRGRAVWVAERLLPPLLCALAQKD